MNKNVIPGGAAILRSALLVSVLISVGCESETGGSAADTETGLVWAVNVGGATYEGIDGTKYEAEAFVQGGKIGKMETVKGSQDPFLYKSYREGDIEVARPISNGTYDITFHFAEPEQFGRGERIFDALVEGRPVIEDLDVMLARDSKVESALTVAIPNVQISDGELNIRFEASVASPVLSALVVRRGIERDESWKLVWSDEFDNDGAPHSDQWSIDVWPPKKVNDEDQAYTPREKNLRVRDGMLIIEAHKEDYEGASYTSGRVHTQGKGDFLYGRIEVRAKLPQGKGVWPAIWMLPSDPFNYATTCEQGEDWQGSDSCDAWPNSGEIDIMENVGYDVNRIHASVHNQAYYWVKWEQRKGQVIVDNSTAPFRTYSIEWSPEDIRILVDSHLYFAYVNEKTGWESWPYDKPFNLILNVAVGGWWGRSGGGIDDDIFPQRMEVDYVRVYERAR